MTNATALLGAAGATVLARALLRGALITEFRRDVRRLNAGDHLPLLAAYADDAVLRFDTGRHRWSGDHRGRPAITHFLREFTSAGLQGEIRDLWLGGAPWALTLVARLDDWAAAPGGTQIYSNSVVLVLRTRWGKIIEQKAFFEDTRRIDVIEDKLCELGLQPLADATEAERR